MARYLQDYYGKTPGIAHEDPVFKHLTVANGMVDMEAGHLKISLDVRYGTALVPEVLGKSSIMLG